LNSNFTKRNRRIICGVINRIISLHRITRTIIIITNVSVISILTVIINLENQTQFRILLAMLREGLHHKSEGITGLELEKKYQIPYTSWNENYKKLEMKSLIAKDEKNTILKKKKRGSERTTKPRYPYLLTELGIFYLIKNNEIKIINNKRTKDGEEVTLKEIHNLIPLIGNYWTQLQLKCKMDGKLSSVFLGVLKYSFHQMKLKFDGDAGFIEEITTIKPSSSYPYSIKIPRVYSGTGPTKQNVIKKSKGPLKKYTELNVSLIERLGFLFYYNLIRLGTDSSFAGRISLETMEFENNINIQQMLDQDIHQRVQIMKRIKQNEKYIIGIIRKDARLDQVFGECLKEINTVVDSRNVLDEVNHLFSLRQ